MVCVADLAGAEAIYPMSEFMELFGQAKKAWNAIYHSCRRSVEAVQNILDSVEQEALRIEHGIAMRVIQEVRK